MAGENKDRNLQIVVRWNVNLTKYVAYDESLGYESNSAGQSSQASGAVVDFLQKNEARYGVEIKLHSF